MPLTAAHRCQICGDVLFHDNLFSDPSQHFCLTVNGPGMADSHADGCDIIKNSISKTTSTPAPQTKTRSRGRADSEDLNGRESEASYATA